MKTSKAYVMRSLLPAKCRELVRAPDVSQAFAMLVLSLIDLSPSKKLSAGAAAGPHTLVTPGVQVSLELACAGSSAASSLRMFSSSAMEVAQENGERWQQVIIHDNLQMLSGSI